ncbi:MAG TPA: hypothetical protein VK842_02055 [bacterium]|jgi:hypothetical protein|nr:hypothetical protein [bacterium]
MIPGIHPTLRRGLLCLMLAAPCLARADAPPDLPALPGDAPAAPLPPPAPVLGGSPTQAPGAAGALSAPAAAPASPTAALAPGDLPLAYKGLRLGMGMAELKAFVDGQPRLSASATDSLNGVTRVSLHSDRPGRGSGKKARAVDPASFLTLGCGGPGGAHCFELQSATVAFLNDKAVSFTLRNQWTMDEAEGDPGLKGWLEFVQAAFSKKYGNPATVSLAPGQTDFEDFQDLWNAAPFVQWNYGPSKVLLELSRSGDICKATIEVQDNAGAAQLLRKDLGGK